MENLDMFETFGIQMPMVKSEEENMKNEKLFDVDEIKGESFDVTGILEPCIYIQLLDDKNKIKKLERKYIRENQSFYKSWQNCDKWTKFKNEMYGTKVYEETSDRIACYEFATRSFKELYDLGVSVSQFTHVGNKEPDCFDLESFVKYLLENGVKIKIYGKVRPIRDVGIIEVSEKYKAQLNQIYYDIVNEQSPISQELNSYRLSKKDEISEDLLLRLHDAVVHGYCMNYDSADGFWPFGEPISKNRPNLMNLLRKYGIEFAVKKLEGIGSYVKRLYQNYKIKLLQIIKRCKKIANFSGGKDSAYMILRGLDEGMKFDHIVYADTGMEYPEMYSYIDRFEQYIKQKIIRLKPKITFDDWFFKNFAYGKNEGKIHGFPYTIGDGCWAKRELKIKSMEAFKKSIGEPVIDYIGIAADEPERYKKLILDKQQAPLVDWGTKEAQCRSELENVNLLNPLYCKFKRLGCWCCPKQNMGSLRVLYNDYPKLWQQLREYQQYDFKPFKPGLSVKDIEKKIILLNQQ